MPKPHPDNPQCVERYVWFVHYEDETTLCEYPEPTKHLSFDEVDKDRVVKLTMMPNPWLEEEGPEFIVFCSPKENIRPMCVRQNSIHLLTGQHIRYHVFGTQKTVNGANVQQLMYLPDDGPLTPLILTDRRLEMS